MHLKQLQQYLQAEVAKYVDVREVKSIVDILLEKRVGYNAISVNLYPQTILSQNVLFQIEQDLKLLAKDYPIQYIVEETEFCGLKIKVSPDVLIPRQETEELVDWILQQEKSMYSCLDICTGSGCIAIALAKNSPQTQVSACDISEKALAIAIANAEWNETNVHFFPMDICNPNRGTGELYDVIVSNPPYVCETEKMLMAKRVLDYEPDIALFVPDENSLVFYDAIAKFALQHLQQNGSIYVEINEKFGSEILQLLQDYGYSDVQLRQDINGKDRMVKGTLKHITR